ncbi:unnamed protein product [Symbiodinium sp. CCMP2592]|nr:unnamed protein product [Symbiodinium sp. CCMP2592]
MTSPLGRSAPWSVMGLATLLGMLCVDWVFDTGDSMQEAKVYYCALLPTLFSFPQCLRILIPVAFSGVHILMNLQGAQGQGLLAREWLTSPPALCFYLVACPASTSLFELCSRCAAIRTWRSK